MPLCATQVYFKVLEMSKMEMVASFGTFVKSLHVRAEATDKITKASDHQVLQKPKSYSVPFVRFRALKLQDLDIDVSGSSRS